MKIGYIRVSTQEQNTMRQEVLMEQLGVDQIYIDRSSGKNANRPELKTMLEFVRKGDVVIVESISRFARNTKDLLELVEQLSTKGVEFISQKEAIDTSTPNRKVYADDLRRCGGIGAGVHSATTAGRNCDCKRTREIHWAKTGRTSQFLQSRGTDEKYHKYIGPVVGKMRLRDVRDIQLQSILNEQRGMSFSHVTKLRMVMQELFHQAYRSMFTRQWKVEQTLSRHQKPLRESGIFQ